MGIFSLFFRKKIEKEVAPNTKSESDKIEEGVNNEMQLSLMKKDFPKIESRNIENSNLCLENESDNTQFENILSSKRDDKCDPLSNLNEEQKRAVCFAGKHLLVLAGAGTGKTKTIISRAVYLLEQGVSPSKILILSFTRKSANEIVNRIKLLNSKSIGLTGQTFHSWCMSIIKSNPNIFQCESATCLDEDDKESAIKLLCGKNFKDKDAKRVSPDKIIDVYSYAMNAKCSLSEAIRVKVYDNGDYESVKNRISKNKSVYEYIIRKYILYKKEHNYIDYDDILSIVSTVLKNRKDISQFISSKYEHILIDEMQDTNPLQYELLSSFYDNCHLFCVGDDAQSIYGFRGADFKTIHNFTNVVDSAVKVKLSLNYRSTQEILDVANWLLDQSPLKYDKKLISFKGNGEKPQIIHVDNDWDEAEHITNDILQNISEKGNKYSDHLVLSRTVWGLRLIEAHCLAKKIPYMVFGGTQLMQSKHVRDVMSVLRISSNFRDELAWIRYLQLWERIGYVSSARIIQSLSECITLKECISKLKLTNLQKEIYETLEHVDGLQNNPAKAIREALQIMHPRLSVLYKDNNWEGRKKDFILLENMAYDKGSISEFIAEYVLDPKLEMYNKKEGKNENMVILSTIHSAKGLEADNCYIVNVSPFSYPTPRSVLNGMDAVEEERRCLYVALTRAKNKLYIYKNVEATSAAGLSVEHKDYEGEIKEGDLFCHKRNKVKVQIVSVEKNEDSHIVKFKLIEPDINANKLRSITEWAFRKAYILKIKHDSINANLSYFFNNIPSDIIEYKYISSGRPLFRDRYKSDTPFTDWDNFNFD